MIMRRYGLLTAAALVAATLAACSPAAGPTGGTATGGAAAGGAGAEGFPVTIESALGGAVIEEAPERVVTLGMGSAETAVALGVTPVGVEEYPWGSDGTGYLPWLHEAVIAAGDDLPTQFTGATDIDLDAVLLLEPDVILAPWSGITQEQFDQLNQIAPTVAYPDLPWSIDWDQQIETIGTALGRSDEASALVDDIEQQFAAVAAEHPEYADVTFSYIYTDGPGTLGVFLPDEQRVAMLRNIGLTVDPVVETLPEAEGTDSSVIGLENADTLDESDLIFTFYSDEAARAEAEAQPLYAQIPAIARGSLVTTPDQPFVTASSIINPLTVPWVLERYTPMIDEAIAALDRTAAAAG